MKYRLNSLNNLKKELDYTNVISKDFKITIMEYALEVARESVDEYKKELELIKIDDLPVIEDDGGLKQIG